MNTYTMLIYTNSSLFSCAGKGFVYNHKLCSCWSRWISTIQKHKRTSDLQKGICLKSLWFMFQRIIFSCQHETGLNLWEKNKISYFKLRSIPDQLVQAFSGDDASLVSDHCNKVNIAIQRIKFFCFPGQIKVYTIP